MNNINDKFEVTLTRHQLELVHSLVEVEVVRMRKEKYEEFKSTNTVLNSMAAFEVYLRAHIELEEDQPNPGEDNV